MRPSAADELVRGAARDHDDVAGRRLDRALTDGEEDVALLDDERLLVGVPVQLRTGAGPVVAEEERDRRAVLVAPEDRRVLATRKLVAVDHEAVLGVHAAPPGSSGN